MDKFYYTEMRDCFGKLILIKVKTSQILFFKFQIKFFSLLPENFNHTVFQTKADIDLRPKYIKVEAIPKILFMEEGLRTGFMTKLCKLKALGRQKGKYASKGVYKDSNSFKKYSKIIILNKYLRHEHT